MRELGQKLSSFSLLLILGASGLSAAKEEALKVTPEFKGFVQDYCLDCHNAEKSKGDRAFHDLFKEQEGQTFVDISDENKLYDLQDVLDQLNLGEMPPHKKGVKQPSKELNKRIRHWLTDTLLGLDEQTKVSHTLLRRLNKTEYRNTLEDILGLKHLSFDPLKEFPLDENHHGFINMGEHLSLSDKHLKDALDISERYLKMALHFGSTPESRVLNVTPEMWGLPERISRSTWMYRIRKGNEYVDIGAGRKDLTQNLSLASVPKSFMRGKRRIQTQGYYEIEVTAEAIRRLTHPYDPSMIPAKLDQPMQLGLYIAENSHGVTDGGAQYRQRVGLWDLADHQQKTFKVKVWMDKGAIPFFNWDNGPGPSDWWMRDVLVKYHTDIEFKGKEGSHAWHFIGKDLVPGRIVSDVWKGPLMRIHNLKVTGPLSETYMSQAQQDFFDGVKDPGKVNLKFALEKFMTRAFRRPVAQEEVLPYYGLYEQAKKQMGKTQTEAIFTALKAVLVSPEFLYHNMKKGEGEVLEAFALAGRLSYALWSSIPDQKLFGLAKTGRLLEPNVLKHQIRRMLEDPRSASFVEGFANSWLRLDKLGSMPPDANKYLNYYDENLEELMAKETRLFLNDHIQNNLPLLSFLNSEETYVNEALAEFYGMQGVKGQHFRKVNWPDMNTRGGLLGQASILTLTSNGVETSPVTRGVWVLEAILGTPPPPPPPDVEPLDPDTRGAVTLKQRLDKHRKVESCADCHAKIDPFGFPLENYDAIGMYRPNYFKSRRWHQGRRQFIAKKGAKVDGYSELDSGESFSNLKELREVLMTRKEQFSKMLVEKLLVYTTGREMNFKDHGEIEDIALKKPAESYGFKDLIVETLSSSICLKR